MFVDCPIQFRAGRNFGWRATTYLLRLVWETCGCSDSRVITRSWKTSFRIHWFFWETSGTADVKDTKEVCRCLYFVIKFTQSGTATGAREFIRLLPVTMWDENQEFNSMFTIMDLHKHVQSADPGVSIWGHWLSDAVDWRTRTVSVKDNLIYSLQVFVTIFPYINNHFPLQQKPGNTPTN